ncbi:MAG: DeoR/GlpR family DNA-binding transcription regulator [Eubacteriales bacterium]|nr:DeoR/GlpR family DNA-binding transcription regulator [Eubacteriales bacterium]
MKDTRRKRMEQFVQERHSVSMEQLCREFSVSMNTVRADVAYLVEVGAVEKIYGGVLAVSHHQVPLFEQRAGTAVKEKLKIAQAAAAFIEDHESIFIDAGTTAMHLIDFLSPDKQVTIITGNLYVLSHAMEKPKVELIILPGKLNRRTNAVADGSTLEFLSRYHFNKAFMGASGISPDGKLNVSTYPEYEVKKLAISQCDQSILLADSLKFGASGLMSYGSLDDIQMLITQWDIPQGIVRRCKETGIRLVQTG